MTQRPLPKNTQQSQVTDIHAPGGFRIHPAIERAALGRAATGIGSWNSSVQNSGDRLQMRFWIVRNTAVIETRGSAVCICLTKHC